ncbi:MAG TPA: GNAT family N-acetyltransferase [Chthoniobacteraceae bacterium]|nr:GNAT family N-acetyltransferase [Chthoniobacteraceae bacterium]
MSHHPATGLYDTLSHLCLNVGERHLGSPGEAAAQDYLAARLGEGGYEVVREAFDAPGWEYGPFSITTEGGEAIDAFPCYFSPGGEVTAPLVPYTGVEPPETCRGKIAFSGRHDFTHVGDTNALAEKLEKAGAAAWIVNSPYNDTFSTKIVRNPGLERMPVFTISQRTALRLAREAGRPVHLKLEARRFPHRSANLIARHTGSGRRKLVIGAHYDSAPGIQGAADNGTGIALLVHLVRALKPHLGDWSVDFVAFGAEEYGGPGFGLGGFEYMKAHQEEPIEAMLCLDGLGTFLGNPEARVGRNGLLRRWVKEETGFTPRPYRRGSDQGIFDQHGIPTAWFCDGGAPSGIGHFPLHSPQDVLEIVDFTRLERFAADLERFTGRLLREGVPAAPPAEIVPLEKEDLPAVRELVSAVWTMGMSYRREQLYGRVFDAPWQEKIARAVAEYLADEKVHAVKALVDGTFAGFLSYRIDAANRFGEIGYNAVAPAFGGRNLGRRMLDAALEALRCAGVEDVEVITGLDDGHAPARAVYEGAGFRPMHSSIQYTLRL